MLLYDHLIRLPAEATSSGDLRCGPFGALGGIMRHNLLFARQSADPLVSNVPQKTETVIRVDSAACFLGFEPDAAVGVSPYATTARFIEQLQNALLWSIEDSGQQACTFVPKYEASVTPSESGPKATAVCLPSPIGIPTMSLRCSIEDGEVLEALNTGGYRGVRFGIRIVRMLLFVVTEA